MVTPIMVLQSVHELHGDGDEEEDVDNTGKRSNVSGRFTTIMQIVGGGGGAYLLPFSSICCPCFSVIWCRFLLFAAYLPRRRPSCLAEHLCAQVEKSQDDNRYVRFLMPSTALAIRL